MGLNPWETAYLVTFTGETLNGKLHFFLQCKYSELATDEAISRQCSISTPPENIRKPEVFRGYRNTTLARNGLNMFLNNNWTIRQVKVKS